MKNSFFLPSSFALVCGLLALPAVAQEQMKSTEKPSVWSVDGYLRLVATSSLNPLVKEKSSQEAASQSLLSKNHDSGWMNLHLMRHFDNNSRFYLKTSGIGGYLGSLNKPYGDGIGGANPLNLVLTDLHYEAGLPGFTDNDHYIWLGLNKNDVYGATRLLDKQDFNKAVKGFGLQYGPSRTVFGFDLVKTKPTKIINTVTNAEVVNAALADNLGQNVYNLDIIQSVELKEIGPMTIMPYISFNYLAPISEMEANDGTTKYKISTSGKNYYMAGARVNYGNDMSRFTHFIFVKNKAAEATGATETVSDTAKDTSAVLNSEVVYNIGDSKAPIAGIIGEMYLENTWLKVKHAKLKLSSDATGLVADGDKTVKDHFMGSFAIQPVYYLTSYLNAGIEANYVIHSNKFIAKGAEHQNVLLVTPLLKYTTAKDVYGLNSIFVAMTYGKYEVKDRIQNDGKVANSLLTLKTGIEVNL